MPSKSANVKNVEVPGGSHCQLSRCLEPRWKEIGVWIQF
jgi:hypothetical protein